MRDEKEVKQMTSENVRLLNHYLPSTAPWTPDTVLIQHTSETIAKAWFEFNNYVIKISPEVLADVDYHVLNAVGRWLTALGQGDKDAGTYVKGIQSDHLIQALAVFGLLAHEGAHAAISNETRDATSSTARLLEELRIETNAINQNPVVAKPALAAAATRHLFDEIDWTETAGYSPAQLARTWALVAGRARAGLIGGDAKTDGVLLALDGLVEKALGSETFYALSDLLDEALNVTTSAEMKRIAAEWVELVGEAKVQDDGCGGVDPGNQQQDPEESEDGESGESGESGDETSDETGESGQPGDEADETDEGEESDGGTPGNPGEADEADEADKTDGDETDGESDVNKTGESETSDEEGDEGSGSKAGDDETEVDDEADGQPGDDENFGSSDQEFDPVDPEILDQVKQAMESLTDGIEESIDEEARRTVLSDPREVAKEIFGNKRHRREFGRRDLSYQKWAQRTPNADDVALLKKAVREFESLGIQQTTRSVTETRDPGGRLNIRNVIGNTARRERGLNPNLPEWRQTRIARNTAPPMTVGIMSDVSRSMSRTVEAVGTVSWALTQASFRCGANTASVTFGAETQATSWPRESVSTDVTIRKSTDSGHEAERAAAALEGALNFTAGARKAQVLVIISDLEWSFDSAHEGITEWIQKFTESGVHVILVQSNRSENSSVGPQRLVGRYAPDSLARELRVNPNLTVVPGQDEHGMLTADSLIDRIFGELKKLR